jgi:parvulin-like peptidyl-prolyl isomerase
MSKASFMSMKWLRLHIKEIIWTTIILFVSSIFIIGYGTSRAIQRQEERKQKADEAERRAAAQKNAIPANLQNKLHLPVAHISYLAQNASLTTTIDVKSLWRAVKDSPEYQQVSAMPEGIKDFYGSMIKERALETLITMSLVDLYAQANSIKPQVTPEAIVANDLQQISPVEFERELRRKGLSVNEYGQERLKQLTMQTVAQAVVQPIPPASATEDVLRKYYEDNKLRFKLDDQISFNHLVISPDDFAGKTEITDEQIKEYFDNHRQEFMSSKRVDVSHIFINPDAPEYLNTIEINDREVRQRYTDNIDKYKEPEKVKARHILIKPKDSFEEKFSSFQGNFRNFKSEETEDGNLISFEVGISNIGPETDLNFDSFAVKTTDGQMYYATAEAQQSLDSPLDLPVFGATKTATQGRVAILTPANSEPAELMVKDGSITTNFAIDSAFSSEKAFAAAEKEINKILAEIKNGKDFAEMAKARSEDTGSAVKGGDLGAFARGAMVKPFEEVAFASNVGQVSQPVKTQFGYHIIKVEEKIPEKVRSLDEVRGELMQTIKKQQADLNAATALQNARQKIIYKSNTMENLVKMHSMGASRKNDGKLPVFFKGQITDDYSEEQKKILLAEVSEDGSSVAKAIEEALWIMEPGQVSEVIKTGKGYHLFVLNRILEPIQLSLTTSLKARIHKILERQGQEEMAKKAADQLRADYPNASVEFLAKTYKADEEEVKVSFESLSFSANPGFSSYSLSDGIGKFSDDGRTYLPEVHKNIMTLIKGDNYKGKIAGPFRSELGYHFIEVTDYQGNRFEEFAEIKEKIRRMVTLEPTQEEIEKEFEANKDKLDTPARRRIRQIIVNEERVANEIHERLKKGEIFALLAKKFSIDSGTAQNGGLTPPVAKGQLSPELDKQVWKLEKGEFTEPVKTPYGYVIAYLDADEIPGSQATLDPATTSRIKRNLKQQIQEEVWMSFLNGLNNQARVIRHPQAISDI